MKTKSKIEMPKGTTHIRATDDKGKTGQMDVDTFAGLTAKEVQDMGKLEFLKVTGKGKRSTCEVLTNKAADKSSDGVAITTGAVTQVVDKAQVSAATGIVADTTPAPVKTIVAGLSSVNDALTCTGKTWNAGFAEVHPVIDINDPATSIPARFEYVEEKFPGSQWSILHCSDNGQEVGVPFKAKSYTVMNMAKLRKFIETLQAGIEKLGLKVIIETTGTINDRARQFVSFRIDGLDKFTVDGREIHSFLNVLNSIDKSCHVTFANQTFTVCCQNTFAMAKDGQGAPLYGKVKHTAGMDLKLAEVPLIVESFITGNKAIFAKLNEWTAIGMTATQAECLFAAWLGDAGLSTRSANMIDRLKELFAHGKGNKGETAFDAFNAATEYYTHESAGKSDDIAKQWQSSEQGDGARSKTEFFDYLGKALVTSEIFAGVCKCGDAILVAYRKATIDKATAKATKK